MTKKEVMDQLAKMGSEGTKKTLMKHGAQEPLFGVKVGDLKTIQKKIKTDQTLAEELYATGNADAQYLAALIADKDTISEKTLNTWAQEANSPMIAEYSVPWITADAGKGKKMAEQWFKSKDDRMLSTAWSTLSAAISIADPDVTDEKYLKKKLKEVEQKIDNSGNRTRYAMNGFVISVGSYIADLQQEAIDLAERIGKVSVDMNGTACKVPDAATYIEKVKKRSKVAKVRKEARC